ncbi:hypothetical protein MMC07_007224 [Pseudocyphellaria aurata]|nr:hypothetical protein [Pseudocyphellaria aurata]
MGARLFRQGISSKFVGFVANEVFDEFPNLKNDLLWWRTACVLRARPEGLTAKGWNEYLAIQETRDDLVLTPDYRVHPDLMEGDRFMGSKTYHLFCGPARCIELVNKIMERRASIDPKGVVGMSMMKRPIFVWQPLPSSCTPSEIPNFYAALKYVDVVSPSLADLVLLFEPHDTSNLLMTLEKGCNMLLALGFGNKASAVVVRVGEIGTYIATIQRHSIMPPYHVRPDKRTSDETRICTTPYRVVDPSGAGPAFLGGFCIGLLADRHPFGFSEFEVGGLYGTVAASFAIEQFGLPKLEYDPSPISIQETWNNETVRKRLTEFEWRMTRTNMHRLSDEDQQRLSLYMDKPCPNHGDMDDWPKFRRVRKSA